VARARAASAAPAAASSSGVPSTWLSARRSATASGRGEGSRAAAVAGKAALPLLASTRSLAAAAESRREAA